MNETNNSQETDRHEPVDEKTIGQETSSEKNNSGGKFSVKDWIAFLSLFVGLGALVVALIGLYVGILSNINSKIDANRAETLTRIESLGESLRSDIRAGFGNINTQVNSNNSRIDKLYDRGYELSQKRAEEVDSLGIPAICSEKALKGER